jgi:hypothetical protein
VDKLYDFGGAPVKEVTETNVNKQSSETKLYDFGGAPSKPKGFWAKFMGMFSSDDDNVDTSETPEPEENTIQENGNVGSTLLPTSYQKTSFPPETLAPSHTQARVLSDPSNISLAVSHTEPIGPLSRADKLIPRGSTFDVPKESVVGGLKRQVNKTSINQYGIGASDEDLVYQPSPVGSTNPVSNTQAISGVAQEIKGAVEVPMTAVIAGSTVINPLEVIPVLATFYGLDYLENKVVNKMTRTPNETKELDKLNTKLKNGGLNQAEAVVYNELTNTKGLAELFKLEGLSKDAIDLGEFFVKGIIAGSVTNTGRNLLGTIVKKITGKENKVAFINDIASEVKQTGVSPDDVINKRLEEIYGKKIPESKVFLSDVIKDERRAAAEKVEVERRSKADKYDLMIEDFANRESGVIVDTTKGINKIEKPKLDESVIKENIDTTEDKILKDEPQEYYHMTPEQNIENINKQGFDLSKQGKGIGQRRNIEAEGISLTNDNDVINAYEEDSKVYPFAGTGKLGKLGKVKVTVDVKNSLDLINKIIKLKDLVTDDNDLTNIVYGIANSGESPGTRELSLTKKLQTIIKDVKEGEVLSTKILNKAGELEIKASEVPDYYIQSLLGGKKSPKEVTNELTKLGYDSIKYKDELKVFNPNNIKIFKEEGKNAIEKGNIETSNLGEHSGVDEVGKGAETSGGNLLERGGEVKPEPKKALTDVLRKKLINDVRKEHDEIVTGVNDVSDYKGALKFDELVNGAVDKFGITKEEAENVLAKVYTEHTHVPINLNNFEDVLKGRYNWGDFNSGINTHKPTAIENADKSVTYTEEPKAQPKTLSVGDEIKFGGEDAKILEINGTKAKIKLKSMQDPDAYANISLDMINAKDNPDVAFSKAMKKTISESGDEVVSDKIKLKADQDRLLDILGSSMYSENLAYVAVKELAQNSFDAIKEAQHKKVIKGTGNINIKLDYTNSLITIKDDGIGMTPEIIKNSFFTIAGSNKDVPPELRSGGLGLAKMAFMLGSEHIKVETMRDGFKTVVDVSSSAIRNKAIQRNVTRVDKSLHGTEITIKLPREFTDPKTGETKNIWFPSRLKDIQFMQKPLLGDVKIIENKSYDDEILNIGKHQDLTETPKLTKANFKWGNADIYFGTKLKTEGWGKDSPTHSILSSGIHQFDYNFKDFRGYKIPFDIIVDIKSGVDVTHPNYPFTNDRENFRSSVRNDIGALSQYLNKVSMGYRAGELKEGFKEVNVLPRIKLGAKLTEEQIDETGKTIRGVKDKVEVEEKVDTLKLVEPIEEINIADNVTDNYGNVIVDKERVSKTSFSTEDKAPEMKDSLVKLNIDINNPIFHNNTNLDFDKLGISEGSAEKLIASLGSVVAEMRDKLVTNPDFKYSNIKDTFVGISLDKEYQGVIVKVPYNGIFINPFGIRGKTLFSIRNSFYDTMVHEFAHPEAMSHGEYHNSVMQNIGIYLTDNGLEDLFKDNILKILNEHSEDFLKIRSEYDRSTTKNIGKTLGTTQFKVKSRGKTSDTEGLGGDKSKPLQTGEGLGRERYISGDLQLSEKRELSGRNNEIGKANNVKITGSIEPKAKINTEGQMLYSDPFGLKTAFDYIKSKATSGSRAIHEFDQDLEDAKIIVKEYSPAEFGDRLPERRNVGIPTEEPKLLRTKDLRASQEILSPNTALRSFFGIMDKPVTDNLMARMKYYATIKDSITYAKHALKDIPDDSDMIKEKVKPLFDKFKETITKFNVIRDEVNTQQRYLSKIPEHPKFESLNYEIAQLSKKLIKVQKKLSDYTSEGAKKKFELDKAEAIAKQQEKIDALKTEEGKKAKEIYFTVLNKLKEKKLDGEISKLNTLVNKYTKMINSRSEKALALKDKFARIEHYQEIRKKLSDLYKQEKAMEPEFKPMANEFDEMYTDLQNTSSNVRVFAAADGTLKEGIVLTPQETRAANMIKAYMEMTRGELEAQKIPVIKESSYMTHLIRPLIEDEEFFSINKVKAKPTLLRFISRVPYSRPWFPSAHAVMEAYVPMAEYRLAYQPFLHRWRPFVDKIQQPRLRKYMEKWMDSNLTNQGTSGWDKILNAAVAFEYARTIGLSLSVGVKHGVKILGTPIEYGLTRTVQGLPHVMVLPFQSGVSLVKAHFPTFAKALEKIGVTGKNDQLRIYRNYVMSSDIIRMMSEIPGLRGIDDAWLSANTGKTLKGAFLVTEKLIRNVISQPVKLVEMLDNGASVMAAIVAGKEKGKSPLIINRQIWEGILDVNFRGGPDQSLWLKKTFLRAMAMFQQTPLKLMERIGKWGHDAFAITKDADGKTHIGKKDAYGTHGAAKFLRFLVYVGIAETIARKNDTSLLGIATAHVPFFGEGIEAKDEFPYYQIKKPKVFTSPILQDIIDSSKHGILNTIGNRINDFNVVSKAERAGIVPDFLDDLFPNKPDAYPESYDSALKYMLGLKRVGSEFDNYATEVMSERSFGLPTEKSKFKRDLRLQYDRGFADKSDLNEAVNNHDITEQDKNEIISWSKMDKTQRAVKKMSIDEVVNGLKHANEDELEIIKPLLKNKIFNSWSRGTINRKKYDEYNDILNEL